MATSKIRLPADGSNTGPYLGTETQTLDAVTAHMYRWVQSDKAVDQTVGVAAKGVQGVYGSMCQDFKDSGRAIFNCSTAIAGVTAVTTEALVSLATSRDGAATSNLTTIPVTSGKRLRITMMTASCITTGATVLSGRISLRMNPAGAATATSVIMWTVGLAAPVATAQTGNSICLPVPDGTEFSGTMQIGVTQVFSATSGTIWVSVHGYEY